MIKKLNLKILITSVVTLLPIMLVLVNEYFVTSLFLALGIPIVFTAINIFINMYLDKYERFKKIKSINIYHCRWIIPIVSIVLMSIIISGKMKIDSSIYYIIMSIIGIFICSSGIKIIDAKKESSTTYFSRFEVVAYIWIFTGLLFTSLVYLRVNWVFVFFILCLVIYLAPLLIFQVYKHVK